MLELLSELRKKVAIGFTGGSDFAKISEQLSTDGNPGSRRRSNPIALPLNFLPLYSHRKIRLRIYQERVDRLQTGKTTPVAIVY